jgi:starch synthase
MLTFQNLEARSACPDLVSADLRPDARPVISVTRRQSILFVTSEIADYVKAGGLGEVSAALPRALRHQYDVRILIPGFRQVLSQVGPVEQIATLPSSFGIPACSAATMRRA